MKITYRQASLDDVTRQFRYYLVELDLPEVAMRFTEAVRKTSRAIAERPRAAPPYRLRNPQFQNLRSWPVADFEMIRFYFVVEHETVRVKRNIRGILERERISEK